MSSYYFSPNKVLTPYVQHSSQTEFNTTINGMLRFEYSQLMALSPNLCCHFPHILALKKQHHFVNRVSSKAPPFVWAYALPYLRGIRWSPPLISSMHPHVNVPLKWSSITQAFTIHQSLTSSLLRIELPNNVQTWCIYKYEKCFINLAKGIQRRTFWLNLAYGNNDCFGLGWLHIGYGLRLWRIKKKFCPLREVCGTFFPWPNFPPPGVFMVKF